MKVLCCGSNDMTNLTATHNVRSSLVDFQGFSIHWTCMLMCCFKASSAGCVVSKTSGNDEKWSTTPFGELARWIWKAVPSLIGSGLFQVLQNELRRRDVSWMWHKWHDNQLIISTRVMFFLCCLERDDWAPNCARKRPSTEQANAKFFWRKCILKACIVFPPMGNKKRTPWCAFSCGGEVVEACHFWT